MFFRLSFHENFHCLFLMLTSDVMTVPSRGYKTSRLKSNEHYFQLDQARQQNIPLPKLLIFKTVRSQYLFQVEHSKMKFSIVFAIFAIIAVSFVAAQRQQPVKPATQKCNSNCFCTFDRNPVCGSNGQTYNNNCALQCERRCYPRKLSALTFLSLTF